MMRSKHYINILALLLALIMLLTACSGGADTGGGTPSPDIGGTGESVGLGEIPQYSGAPYIAVNGNSPYFEDDEIVEEAFETYAELDTLGRCGVAFACVGVEMMPTEDRDFSLSSVSPSGWMYNGKSNNNVYPTSVVPGGYIYNRCHLIGFQLTGETTNKQNLITGTKYLNIDGMLPFENMVADFIRETGYHVMYRVTPVYEEYDLVASGVLIEAYSVEDEGEGISFCVYAYNVQPGVEIDYFTGENRLVGDETPDTPDSSKESVRDYIINTDSGKVHTSSCSTGQKLSGANRADFTGTLSQLQEKYPDSTQCGICKSFENP